MLKYKIKNDIDDVLQKGTPGYERVQRLKRRILDVKPEVCLERALIVTDFYKKNESMPVILKRANVFHEILDKMTIYILPDELIVGHQSEKQRSAPLFPEFAVEWVKEEMETFPTRDQDKFQMSGADMETFREVIYPYFKGRTFHDKVMQQMTEDVDLLENEAGLFSVGLHEDGGLGHCLMDFSKVLTYGFDGIKREIRGRREALEDWRGENVDKKLFYDAAEIVCDALIHFANRYADLSEKMAGEETDAERKAELLEIAANCRKVPEKPAESYYEALQSYWFVQVTTQIYDNAVSISPGRLDQWMYPYYEKDILEGRMTKARAQELLECMWVKFTEPIKIYRKIDAAFHAGFPMGQNLCVSGLRPDGVDGTNDLSYRCLEAHSHVLMMQPNFSARMHSQSSPEYVNRVLKAVRMGNGMPQVVNDNTYITSMTQLGVTLEDARNYVPVGCVEISPERAWTRGNGGYFNLSKVVELTLLNGKCGITGRQVSIETGDPRNFETFDEFVEAYKKQMKYCMSRLVKWDNILDKMHAEYNPVPFTSIFIDDCIAKGLDATWGGCHYNWTGPLGVGIANAGDSIYAVKKVVYEDKMYSMEQLLNALEHNFEGEEYMRKYLVNRVEKYGNDVEAADECVKLATDVYFDSMKGFETYRGGPFVPALLPVASYVAFGMSTAALPDGHLKGEPLADGISPNYGADEHGPTAVMKSVACIDHVRCGNGVIFNQKISPMAVSTEEGMQKWADLVMGYVNLGGGHVQFNIVSADTLKQAMEEPEKHKGLVVRVAGYSAFFNELAPEVQESIIARTEHEL